MNVVIMQKPLLNHVTELTSSCFLAAFTKLAIIIMEDRKSVV